MPERGDLASIKTLDGIHHVLISSSALDLFPDENSPSFGSHFSAVFRTFQETFGKGSPLRCFCKDINRYSW